MDEAKNLIVYIMKWKEVKEKMKRKVWTEMKRNRAKKIVFSFEKWSEKEAKRYPLVWSEKWKEAMMGHPTRGALILLHPPDHGGIYGAAQRGEID